MVYGYDRCYDTMIYYKKEDKQPYKHYDVNNDKFQ